MNLPSNEAIRLMLHVFHVFMSILICTIVSTTWGRIEVSYDNDSTLRADL